MDSHPLEEKTTLPAQERKDDGDASDAQQQTQSQDVEPEPLFSIYSPREKKFIVLMRTS